MATDRGDAKYEEQRNGEEKNEQGNTGFAPPSGEPGSFILFRRGNVPLLDEPIVHTSFWGDAWDENEDLGRLRAALERFIERLFADETVRGILNLYGNSEEAGIVRPLVPKERLSQPRPERPPDRRMTDGQIRRQLERLIPPSEPAARGPRHLRVIFLPPGTAVVRERVYRSCRDFCAYHDVIEREGQPPLYYVVVPFPNCLGCTQGLNLLDALTVITSHELYNALTDPHFGDGRYDPAHHELGDWCMSETAELRDGEASFKRRALWNGDRCV